MDRAGSRAKEIFFSAPKTLNMATFNARFRSRFLLNVMNRARVLL